MTDGDSFDWNDIVVRHAPRVVRIAFRILGSVQDAEDVSQEVFTEALHMQTSTVVENWEALFVRLATLRALDGLRRRRPFAEIRSDDKISDVEPADELAARELADWLRSSVADLPERQAAVFTMTCFEQLTRDEISAALGISPAAISTALHKARQQLLSKLAVFHRGESDEH